MSAKISDISDADSVRRESISDSGRAFDDLDDGSGGESFVPMCTSDLDDDTDTDHDSENELQTNQLSTNKSSIDNLTHRRYLTVFGYIRYNESKYDLPYDIPNGIKTVCLNFYGLQEIMKVVDGDMKIETNTDNNNDIITLSMPVNNFGWSTSYGTNIINSTKNGIYSWDFKINKLGRGALVIGIIDTNNKTSYKQQSHLIDPNGRLTFEDGDTLKMEVHLYQNTDSFIKFYKNDECIRTVFQNKIQRKIGKYYVLLIQLIWKDNEIQLIQYTEK